MPAPAGSFKQIIKTEQEFTLLEPAYVTLPTFLFGSVVFTPHASNTSTGDVLAEVQVYDPLGAPTALHFLRHYPAAALPPVMVNDFAYQNELFMTPGKYTVRSFLTVQGAASNSGVTTTEVTVDFGSTARTGLVTSVGSYAVGLDDSREFVRAPEARSFGGGNFDGSGIQVGVLELGKPYETHTSLPPARLLDLPGPNAGDFRSEHALAVAGLIASDSPDDSEAGIAPGATIVSAAMNSYANDSDAFHALIDHGVRIINMSAGTARVGGLGVLNEAVIEQAINDHDDLLMIMAAGNDGYTPGGGSTIGFPGWTYNLINVGALNRDFNRRIEFSATSDGGLPIKPDLVAPGEYIMAPVSRDINGGGVVNDFDRAFLGDDYYRGSGTPSAGPISGTSFAAPMVAGAAALLHDYQSSHTLTHDLDHRVLKSVLLNGATTNVTHADGTSWQQVKTGTIEGRNLVITQSLDTELGAGSLDVYASLANYAAVEARADDDNSARHRVISTIAPLSETANPFWDLEMVGAASGADYGTVDYRIGENPLGEIPSRHLRATLSWDYDNTLLSLPELELRLYHEGDSPGNLPGFDPLNPTDDILLAQTSRVGENVKLIDIKLPNMTDVLTKGYYVEVVNATETDTVYGLAVTFLVPEPSSWAMTTTGLGVLAIALWVRSRRSRRQAQCL